MAYDGSIKFDTSIDQKKFNNEINKLKSMAKVGFAAVGSAAAAGIGAAIKVGMDFEAQMSKVGAISMASAEDMEILSKKAKEMGETTVFSASQAGEAFEYMAMAGWKTAEMTAGIAGIMDLAAASGESLGAVSDIVTDALTAFGLAAQDSGRFADVLAAASSNSNTNVGMMGETFKYVAPLAGSLGYSIEDTAVAIGLMANSGIKAGQAGTSLRSIMTRLTKPVDEAKTAIKELGLSLTDSSGEIKPLNVLMKDLRTAFAKLDDAQKPAYAAMLGGQEAMSGLLAIVNASDKDFDKLTAAIENADGAASKMAERNLDNLKGQLTLAGSAAEGLGIAIYEGIEEPLKDAVKEGTNKISELTKALKSGDLQPALQNVGKLLGSVTDIVVELATAALPPLVSAIGFLGSNMQTILPVLLGIVASTKAYHAIGIATTTMTTAWSTATAILNAHETAHRITLVALNGGLTVFQTLVGVCTGQITLQTAATGLATKAQIAFNAALQSNPIGLILGITTVTIAATYALCKAINTETEAEKARREAIEKNISAIKEQKKAYEDAQEAIYDKANADIAQIDHVKTLASELQTLVDKNGKVKDADKARVDFILGELNDALGTEYERIGDVVQKNEDLQKSIWGVIDAEKLQILMDAQKEKYSQAVQGRDDALEQRRQALNNLMPVEKEYKAALEELSVCEAEYQAAREDGDSYDIQNAANAVSAARQRVSAVKDEYAGLKSTYDDAEQTYQNYCKDIEVYQEARTLAEAGSVQAAIEYLEQQNSAYLDAEKAAAQYAEGSRERIGTLGNAYETALIELDAALKRYGEDANESTKQAVINAAKSATSAKSDYEAAGGVLVGGMITTMDDQLNATELDISTLLSSVDSQIIGVKSKGEEFGANFGEGITAGTKQVSDSTLRMLDNAVDGISVASWSNGLTIGKELDNGIAVGISQGTPAIRQAAAHAIKAAIDAAKEAGDIHSPSRDMEKEVGLQLALGAVKGWLKGEGKLTNAMENSIETGISYSEKAASLAAAVGQMIPENMASGMAENEEKATEQFDKMLAVLDHQRAMDIINEQEYYEGLEKLRDEYLTKGTKEYAQQTEKIYSYYNSLTDRVKNLFSEIAEAAADKLDDVQGEIDSFAEKIRDVGGLYDTIDLGGGREYKRLRDLSADTEAMQKYADQLMVLRERLNNTGLDAGVVKMFFAELRDLDMAEGADLARMFNQMSDASFAEYLADYKSEYDASQTVAQMLYGDEYADAVQEINENTSAEIIKFMKDELEAAGAEIPDGFFDVGRQSAENFSGSFMNVFQGMLNEIKAQFDVLSTTIAPQVAYAGAGGGYSTVTNTTMYNLYGNDNNDLTAQIESMETRKRMAGIGG